MKILADTGTVFETGTTNPLAITYLDDTHFVIAYRDVTDGNKGKVVCGVIDELTPTLGAIVEFSSVAVWTEISISRLDDTHFVIAYEIAAPASGICKVGSVSGTTITMGGAKTFAAGAVSYYDVCGMDATHFVVAFTLDSPYTGRAIAGSVSGTTITMGVVDVFASTDRSALYTSICSLDSSHFVIAYRGSLSGGSVVVCGTLSGNTVTVTEDGGSSFATSNSAYKTSVCAIDDTHFVITYSEYPGYAGKVIAGSVSGTTITIVEDGASTFESGYTQTPSVARVSATGFVISFVDVTDSSKGKVIIGEPEGTSAGGGAHIAQTGDAHLKKASTFWASAHDAEEADSVEGGSTILVGASYNANGDNQYEIYRPGLAFDLEHLTPADLITVAELRLWVIEVAIEIGPGMYIYPETNMYVYSSKIAGAPGNPPVVADFDRTQYGFPAGVYHLASFDEDDIVTGQYIVIDLLERLDENLIFNKGGMTELLLIGWEDYYGQYFLGGATSSYRYNTFYSSAESGKEPTLYLEYKQTNKGSAMATWTATAIPRCVARATGSAMATWTATANRRTQKRQVLTISELGAGETLRIEPRTAGALIDDVSRPDVYSGPFPRLYPGENTITIEGGEDLDVKVTHSPRWI